MSKNIIAVVLTFSLVFSLIAPVLAIDYKPGVSAGQFAEYRTTYESDSPDDPEMIDDRPYWFRMEVLSVSGSKITIQLDAKLKNGSSVEGSGGTFEFDVENGGVNGWQSAFGPLGVAPRFLFAPVNITYSSGQLLYDTGLTNSDVGFEKTETRTFLGASQSVNVFTHEEYMDYIMGNETSQWTSKNTVTLTMVFDKTSGILLEAEVNSRQTSPEPYLNLRTHSTLVNTNVFEVQPADGNETVVPTIQPSNPTQNPTSSPTQTPTITNPTNNPTTSPTATSEPSPTVPEFTALTVLIVIAVFSASFLSFRKKYSKSK